MGVLNEKYRELSSLFITKDINLLIISIDFIGNLTGSMLKKDFEEILSNY